jgi:putative tryptophan/tyrosine transport system substrate-binding protein
LEIGDVQIAARKLNLEVAIVEIRRAEQIAPGLESLRSSADAPYVASDPLLNSNRLDINAQYVEAAGLVSYGPNFPDLFRRAAEYVDKVLRGAKPSDLPVEQPTKFDLVINIKTAKALGLDIPATLLARADEVIE